MGRVPISLFKGDGSFWIAQDSSKHLLTVQLQVCTTSVWVHSMGCPVFCTCSAKAEVIMFSSLTAFLCSLSLCSKVLPVCPMRATTTWDTVNYS